MTLKNSTGLHSKWTEEQTKHFCSALKTVPSECITCMSNKRKKPLIRQQLRSNRCATAAEIEAFKVQKKNNELAHAAKQDIMEQYQKQLSQCPRGQFIPDQTAYDLYISDKMDTELTHDEQIGLASIQA